MFNGADNFVKVSKFKINTLFYISALCLMSLLMSCKRRKNDYDGWWPRSSHHNKYRKSRNRLHGNFHHTTSTFLICAFYSVLGNTLQQGFMSTLSQVISLCNNMKEQYTQHLLMLKYK